MVLSSIALATLIASLVAGATGAVNSAASSAVKSSKESSGIKRIMEEYGVDEELATRLYDTYKGDTFDLFNPSTWGTRKSLDIDAIDKLKSDWDKQVANLGDMPTAPNYELINAQAKQDILDADAKANAYYDQQLEDLYNLYNTSFQESNEAYNNQVAQAQSNLIQSQNALAGSTRYELDRAQRNAIVRGASAAQRLVSNINTQLGMQNQAATQALQTNNQLAQQLLNQRNANAQLRQEYASRTSAINDNRQNLANSQLSRINAAQANARTSAQETYNNDYANWQAAVDAAGGTNPFADAYRRSQTLNSYTKRNQSPRGL